MNPISQPRVIFGAMALSVVLSAVVTFVGVIVSLFAGDSAMRMLPMIVAIPFLLIGAKHIWAAAEIKDSSKLHKLLFKRGFGGFCLLGVALILFNAEEARVLSYALAAWAVWNILRSYQITETNNE